MNDNLWGCPCCGHSGSERAEINKLTSRLAELEAALTKIKASEEAERLEFCRSGYSEAWLIASNTLREQSK